MTDWDVVWERLSAVFQWLVDEVARVNAGARSASGRTSTDVFPFGAYLSCRRGERGVEDLVISVDCKREGDELALSSDIANGIGYVLADGPAARIRKADTNDGYALVDLLLWVDSVAGFVRSQRDLVCSQLNLNAEPV